MSIDVEYGIKRDIRNNPIVREVDVRQNRELHRAVWLAGLALAMVLFSAWQHFETVRSGYEIEQLRLDRAREEAINRQLRLNLETQRSPQLIERRAQRDLGLRAPAGRDTLIIERVPAAASSASVLAQLR